MNSDMYKAQEHANITASLAKILIISKQQLRKYNQEHKVALVD